VIDADGGRAFADRETFQRFCPLRSAAISQRLGRRFRPTSVYLGPAEPDGRPPSEGSRNVALCRYEAAGDDRLVFIAAYQRQSTAEQASEIHQYEREGWTKNLVTMAGRGGADSAFMHFEDHPTGGWLVLEFIHEDVLVDYVLIGSTPEQSADALEHLPRSLGADL